MSEKGWSEHWEFRVNRLYSDGQLKAFMERERLSDDCITYLEHHHTGSGQGLWVLAYWARKEPHD